MNQFSYVIELRIKDSQTNSVRTLRRVLQGDWIKIGPPTSVARMYWWSLLNNSSRQQHVRVVITINIPPTTHCYMVTCLQLLHFLTFKLLLLIFTNDFKWKDRVTSKVTERTMWLFSRFLNRTGMSILVYWILHWNLDKHWSMNESTSARCHMSSSL